jgi:hypothetical protein
MILAVSSRSFFLGIKRPVRHPSKALPVADPSSEGKRQLFMQILPEVLELKG